MTQYPFYTPNTLASAGTAGWCGDGRTVCQGGGYGAQWDRERGMNFGQGFAQGMGSQSGGGDLLLPIVLAIAGIAGFIAYRAKKNEVSIMEYIQSKAEAMRADPPNNVATTATSKGSVATSLIQQAVDQYKRSNSSDTNTASYTNSTIVGDYIAIRDMKGNLLAELPKSQFTS